jgi:hypothetical protein
MSEWESVVALAREVDRECAQGIHIASKAGRLARAVLVFQEQLTPGVRDSRPSMTAAPATHVEPPTDSDEP